VSGAHRVIAAVSRACAGTALVLWLAAAAHAANCDPWPSEPDPLPALNDPDPVRAEWASLRVKELALWANRAERDDPLRARQMWRRLLCIDSANDEALAGVLRVRAVTVHRPELVDQAPVRAGDAWAALDAPLGLAEHRPGAPREALPQGELRALRSAVRDLEARVRTAQFEQAIAGAPALRKRLERAPAGETRTSLIAQSEVLVATAELALGRADAAAKSLRRALAADPALALDPATTPPKVLRALDAARGAAR
jgi:hypothetical protein